MVPGHHIPPRPARRAPICRRQAAMLLCATLCLASVAASHRPAAPPTDGPGPLTRLAQDVAGAALTLHHAWATLSARHTRNDGE